MAIDNSATPRVILLLGSAPDVVRCQAWPKQAFSKMQLFNVANIYAVSAILALIAGVFYWRMIGIL